jgi:peptide/nickel transport system permease protein
LRGILRLILVSKGASIPAFAIGILFAVMFVNGWHWGMPGDSAGALFWSAFIVSFLPAWLLVQTGHGIMAKWNGATTGFQIVQVISTRLLIRLLKLIGFIVVVTISAEEILGQPGLASLLMNGIFSRDFPIILGVTWVFVIIVTLVKLVAGLIEITYNYMNKPVVSTEQIINESPLQSAIPKGWSIFSLVLAGLVVIVAVIAPLVAPYGGNEVHLMDRLSSPSAKYLLGTDQLGRDIFSRLLYGMRIDVLIGLVCAVVLSIIAAGWGILAAYCRKMNNWVGDTLEDVVMLPREIMCAFPWLVLLLLLMSLTAEMGIISVAVITGLVLLPHTIGMIQEAYHSAPNGANLLQGVLKAIPVVFFFTIAGLIIYVSTLSYLGAGVPPGVPELGSILSSEGRQYLFTAPWIGLWPGLCLLFIILFFVMAGETLLEGLGFRSKAVWSKTME